jgi:hypothetical protein
VCGDVEVRKFIRRKLEAYCLAGAGEKAHALKTAELARRALDGGAFVAHVKLNDLVADPSRSVTLAGPVDQHVGRRTGKAADASLRLRGWRFPSSLLRCAL